MIYATLIKINKERDADLLIPKDGEKTVRDFQILGAGTSVSMTVNGEITPLKTLPFKNQVALAHKAKSLFGKLDPKRYALLRHNDKDPGRYRDIEFIQCLEGRIKATRAENPLWRHASVPMRRKNTPHYEFDITLSAQSQLFAMLEGNNADNILKAQFGINDYQQQQMYDWEDKVLGTGNTIPLTEIISLTRKVLMEPRLPPIGIHIKTGLSASKFMLSSRAGDTLSIDNKEKSGKDGDSLRDLIQSPSKSTYERMEAGTTQPFKLSLSQLSLHFAADWALSPQVVIHELCHYVAFCLPTPYLLNRGPVKMSWDDYQTLFAGHGAVWSGIYFRALIDYAYCNESQLYQSAEEHGLLFIKTSTLKISDINDAIATFLEKKQQEA